MLTDVLARGGMKVHRFVPSHRTGCVEMMVNSSMNSRGNGRPTLNRFVLDKCLDLFWTSVIYGWTMICGFQRFLEACILHEVFAEYQQRLRMFLCKTTFAENWFLESCEIWCGDDEDGFCHLHGNLECRLLSSHVHARQQTPNLFQPGFISTTLWTRTLWRWFCVFHCMLHVSNWKLCYWEVHDVYPTTFARPTFSFETGMIFLLKFDAPARCMSTTE